MVGRPATSPSNNSRDFDDNGDDETILSIRLSIDPSSQRPLIGLTLIESFSHRIHVGQTLDSDRFHSLLSLISLHQPQLILLSIDRNVPNYLNDRINSAAKIDNQQRKIQVIKYNNSSMDDSELSSALTPILSDGSSVYLLSQSQPQAFASVYSALLECKLLNNNEQIGRWRLVQIDFHSHLSLDLSAMAALNLFPSPSDSSSEASLFGLLNKGRSVMSSRLLTTWLKQPLLSLELISRRQALISIFLSNYSLRSKLRDGALKRMPDFDKLIRMFQRGRAGLQQIIVLWQFTQRLPTIISVLNDWDYGDDNDRQLVESAFINQFVSMNEAFVGIDSMVHQTIDLEAINRHEFLISSNFNPILAALAEERESLMSAMQEECDTVASNVGLEGKVRISDSTQHGHFLRCSLNDERELRGHKSLIVMESRKDGTKFTTATFRRLSSQYKQVNENYIETQSELVSKAVEVVNSYLPLLEEASNLIGELDLLTAISHVFDNSVNKYCKPTLLPMEKNCLELQEARHPCMEIITENFIPNDLEMNFNTRRTAIITGPNMSGKSSFIRMIGVIQLMAQCGFYVPCASATLSIRDRIFTRIGAGDAQLKGMSTFYKEMSEASTILSQATCHSLVIIDELGRGTSTNNGLALAQAITVYLNETIKSLSLIATHYHELTELANQNDSAIINLHCQVLVEENENSIVMTHHIKSGAIGQSYGVHCARMAKLPQEIIDVARTKAEEYERNEKDDNNDNDDNNDDIIVESIDDIELSEELSKLLNPEEILEVKKFLFASETGNLKEIEANPINENLAQKLFQANNEKSAKNTAAPMIE